MKLRYAALGLTGLLFGGGANAGLLPGNAVYSSYVTNLPDQANNPNFLVRKGAPGLPGSPLAQQFHVDGPVGLASLALRLSAATPGDGGSILVYLVPSNIGNTLPATTTATSNKLASATLLATIVDSSLPTSGVNGCIFGGAAATINTCNTVIPVSAFIPTAGNYWIALTDGSDTNNGGTNTFASSAVWWRSGDNIGLNAAGLSNAHVNNAGLLTSQVNAPNTFELQINALPSQVNAPEPASLALLGAGLAGLGVARRRRTRKPATLA